MDSKDLGIIKPLTKPIRKYGKMKDGVKIGIPYHVKALILADDTYGFKIKVEEKYMILPIITNEFTGVKKKKRKVVFMAFSIDDGLPNNFKIDFETYLRSALWGKVNSLFNLKSRELEKAVMTEEMKSFMYM